MKMDSKPLAGIGILSEIPARYGQHDMLNHKYRQTANVV
jgi:hypothetical protein